MTTAAVAAAAAVPPASLPSDPDASTASTSPESSTFGAAGVEKDELSERLFREARQVLADEPELCSLLHHTVLADGVATFEDAVASTVAYRLLLQPTSSSASFCPSALKSILTDAIRSDEKLEMGHTMSEAVRKDALAVLRRDPACDTVLEVVLFFKGFAALVCHRAARQKWMSSDNSNNNGTGRPRRNFTALFLQSQASAVFGVDIHPGATIGAGIMLDHATGIVIGETARVGDGCTMLHGVTLGGTGKVGGDRHPKVGKNVLIGAGASILGNISIGEGAKIGAGSIVLGPIPSYATAVGAPAKVVGRVLEKNPGSFMDDTLQNVAFLHKSKSSATVSSNTTTDASTSSLTETDDISEEEEEDEEFGRGSEEEEQEDETEVDDEEKKDQRTTQGEDGDGRKPPSSKLPEKPHRRTSRRRSKSHGGVVQGLHLRSAFCPLREYVELAKNAPKGTVTIRTIAKLLLQEGCNECQIGGVFFSMDDRNVGYFAATEDKLRQLRDKIIEYCPMIKPDRVDELVETCSRNCGNCCSSNATGSTGTTSTAVSSSATAAASTSPTTPTPHTFTAPAAIGTTKFVPPPPLPRVGSYLP